uniref:Uncharacterized protein n=1 Tax=Rhipicephalus zambeziensis TaxID=60191 RepID=A0A224YJN6_9ACAR
MYLYLYYTRTVSERPEAVSAKLDKNKTTNEEKKCTIDAMYIATRVTATLGKSSESTQPYSSKAAKYRILNNTKTDIGSQSKDARNGGGVPHEG